VFCYGPFLDPHVITSRGKRFRDNVPHQLRRREPNGTWYPIQNDWRLQILASPPLSSPVPSSPSPTVTGYIHLVPFHYSPHRQTSDTMDMDLSLILGPIVLAVVFNVCPPSSRSFHAFGLYLIYRVQYTGRALFNGITTIPLGIVTHGILGMCTTAMLNGTVTHGSLQAPRRLGLLLGYLPHGRRHVHAVGIRGTELRQPRDLCSSALVSLPNPHRVSSGTIEPIRQAIPNHPHLQYVISLCLPYLQILICPAPTVVSDRVQP